ncbi:MAG: hypothetical protein QOE96_1612 [Blastocatellia bacterium]|jgi:hypothetical protein|nr:hypothetical protein [Blastocatellia bacterium]
MFDSMRSLLGKNEYDEQMSKFEKAKKNYFTSIVQPEESFQISKTICEGALAAQNDQIKALQDAVHQYAQLYQTEVEAAQLLEDAANATLSAGLINLAMSQTGVLFLFTQWQEEKLTARILQDLAGAMVEMRSLQQTPAKAETCLDLLRGVDAARDAFQELNAQLTTLPAFISSVDVKERLEDRLLQASTAQNTLEQQLPYLSAGLCQ